MSKTVYKAAKYIRLSHADDNAGESNSVANQRKLLDSFIGSRPDIEAVTELVDDGFSGILFDRPAFKEMMRDIEGGKINCVIVKDLSRFGREYIETGRYLRTIFPAYGVRLIAVNDHIDTVKDSGDDLIVSIKSVINDAYCRDISVKTRSALKVKRDRGDYVGACPIYGYKKAEDNHNQLVIDPYPADVIRDIFRLRIDGMSAARIADTLNKLGVLSPIEYKKSRGLPFPKGGYADVADAKWSAQTIIRILKDETYTGTLVQGRQSTHNYKIRNIIHKPESEWQRFEDAHQAIIDKPDFQLVQQIMRLDTRIGPNGDCLSGEETVYPFSGLLICGCCGARMKRKTVPYKDKAYYYYCCPTGKKNGCNAGAMMRESILSECVLESIKAHIAGIVSMEELLEGQDRQKALEALAGRIDGQITENENQLREISGYKAKLYESFINGHLTGAEYKSMKKEYTDDEQRFSGAIELLRQEKDDVLAGKSERLGWMCRFKRYENFTELDRRMVVSLIHSIRILTKTDIHITYRYQDEFQKVFELVQKGGAA